MTRHTSKNSLLEDYNNYDYDKNTLKGLCESFDNLLPSSVESKEKINIDQNRSENVKLLGCTTAAINGLIGIKGIVSSALHEPSGKIVAIKRYILEEDNEDINSCHTSQEKFNENTTFIMVRSLIPWLNPNIHASTPYFQKYNTPLDLTHLKLTKAVSLHFRKK